MQLLLVSSGNLSLPQGRLVPSMCGADGSMGFRPGGYKTHRSQKAPTCPEGLIPSCRESVRKCPGARGDSVAGFCPVENGGGGEGRGLGEGSPVCSPEGPRLGGVLRLPPPRGPSRETFSWSSDDQWRHTDYRKGKPEDRAVIRLGYPLPRSAPAFPGVRPGQLIQPLLQSLKRCQCPGAVS